MRRLVPFLLLAFVLAGCGATEVVSPTAETVIGTVAAPAPTAAGNAKAGATLFVAQGCGGCHTYKPAGTKGNVGPDLDNLASDAKKADHGPVPDYAAESIENPSAYTAPGFPAGVMPSYSSLTDTQVSNLVAFLTQNQS